MQNHEKLKKIERSSAKQFKRFDHYWYDGTGVTDPNISTDGNCPYSVGVKPKAQG